MPDEQPPVSANRELSAEIVAAYVSNNQVAADQLPALISTVHQALAGLGKSAGEALVERTPAVPIRRSVTHDFVVCLECSWKGSMLKRHLTTAHGLSVDQYRVRWKLPFDHALTAPAYSERRSTMAKQLGLGRGRMPSTETMAVLETETPPSLRRRGRARTTTTPTETA